jgi:hypothetical protein
MSVVIPSSVHCKPASQRQVIRGHSLIASTESQVPQPSRLCARPASLREALRAGSLREIYSLGRQFPQLLIAATSYPARRTNLTISQE